MKSKLVTVITLVFISLLGSSAYAENLCRKDNAGYVVGFFNGVANTFGDAYRSMNRVRGALTNSYRREAVSYDVFYNTTEGYWSDIQETYRMRGRETSQYWDGFWSRNATNTWDSRERANAFIQEKARAQASEYERLLSRDGVHLTTLGDLSDHRLQIQRYVLAGKKDSPCRTFSRESI